MHGKLNLKTPKKRKIIKLKYIIYILFIYIAFSISFYYSMKNNNKVSNEQFIIFLLNGGNSSMLNDYKLVNVINSTMQYLLKINLSKPSTLLNLTIFKEDEANNEVTIEHNDDYSNLEELKTISSYIEDPYKVDVDNPIIYIYNSHQLENYDNTNLEIYGITPNVLMASYILKQKLNKLGLSTIVEDTNLTEFLTINNWDYSYSYKASRLLILDKRSTYSSIKYLIDIHRDSVTKDVTTIKINGKTYAKVLFVVGMDYDTYKDNLETANKINDIIEEKYPNLSRGILKKSGAGVDGIYNQDISKYCVLIEVGGVENNIEEVFNTIEALAEVIKTFVGENNG